MSDPIGRFFGDRRLESDHPLCPSDGRESGPAIGRFVAAMACRLSVISSTGVWRAVALMADEPGGYAVLLVAGKPASDVETCIDLLNRLGDNAATAAKGAPRREGVCRVAQHRPSQREGHGCEDSGERIGFAAQGASRRLNNLTFARPLFTTGVLDMRAEDLASWISEEHQKVHELATLLQECVACVPRANHEKWISDVRKAFEHFRAHLTKHMSLEEDDGYMVPVAERRPALSREVERLAHEHREFIRMMDMIHHMLTELQPVDELLIRDCCHRIQDFLSYVEHHTNEENLMVLSVFNLDIGTGG